MTLHTWYQKLSRLRKLGRFSDKEYERLYPSDAIPPRMYGMIKAHKPEKRLPNETCGLNNWDSKLWLVRISGQNYSEHLE